MEERRRKVETCRLKRDRTRESNKCILALILIVETNQSYDQNVTRNYYITCSFKDVLGQ
jgi:hypothetical protein